MDNNSNENEFKSNEQKNNSILIKIKHKPIILEYIFSFMENRAFVIIEQISRNEILKSSLKKTFDNSKKDNYLSPEINKNIKKYIYYRKILEEFQNLFKISKNYINNTNTKLNSIIQKNITKENFFKNKNIIEFMNETKIIDDNNNIVNIIEKYLDRNYGNNIFKILTILYGKNYKKDYIINNYRNLVGWYGKTNFKKSLDSSGNQLTHSLKKTLNDVEMSISPLSFYDYCMFPNKLLLRHFKTLKEKNEVELFLEILYDIYHDYFAIINKKDFDFISYPNITKKYRELCRNDTQKKIKEHGLDLYKHNKAISMVRKILYPNSYEDNNLNIKFENIIDLCFNYLSSEDNLYLYNLPKEQIDNLEDTKYDYLDEKYLNYLQENNVKQKIILICIIDRYKYSEFINNISYPYINQLHFNLFDEVNELFMFYNLPINEIYNIFVTYFITIKNYENIKKISFGDEFVINKNQFISYNDEYYQSIISYLIDQYMLNFNNSKENFLEKINLEEIILNDERLDNLYERFKILYGFNKMFPNLKNKNVLELKFKNISDDKFNINFCNYKIFIIDFCNISIDDVNIIIDNINNFILNKLSKNNIEIICFNNFQLSEKNGSNIININKFTSLPNLKEFFINNNNNDNNISISKNLNSDLYKINNNKYPYLYLGYDSEENLIYYRNGISQVQSLEIIDLLNLFNNKITKINLKYEKINIIINKEIGELKIINLSNGDNANNYSLKNLSDFIYYLNNLNILVIKGFNFTFDEIKNKNIKKLFINYFNEDECNKLFKYKININGIKYKFFEQDNNLINKFPQLEEIYIGNLDNEKNIYNKLFKLDNFSNKLQKINIISYADLKYINIKNKNIIINIINKNLNENTEKKVYTKKSKTINNNNNDENDYDYENEEEENDFENEDLFYDEYEDILESESTVVINMPKSKKRKLNDKPKDKEILLIGEKLIPYKDIKIKSLKGDETYYFLNNKILYFKSELLHNVNDYYLITQCFLKINKDININNTNFNLLVSLTDDFKKIYQLKAIKNLFIMFKTTFNNIICIYLNNSVYDKKGNDFCLFLNCQEIFYHCKIEEEKKLIKNNIGISKNITFIEKFDKCDEKFYIDLKAIDLLFDTISNEDYSKANINKKLEKIKYFEIYQIKL